MSEQPNSKPAHLDRLDNLWRRIFDRKSSPTGPARSPDCSSDRVSADRPSGRGWTTCRPVVRTPATLLDQVNSVPGTRAETV